MGNACFKGDKNSPEALGNKPLVASAEQANGGSQPQDSGKPAGKVWASDPLLGGTMHAMDMAVIQHTIHFILLLLPSADTLATNLGTKALWVARDRCKP